MSRPVLVWLVGFGLTACGAPSGHTVSSMNYVDGPVEAACAADALGRDEDFAVVAQDGPRLEVRFADALPLSVIVRPTGGERGEISVFSRLPEASNPLQRRQAAIGVRVADELIHRACTEDGRTNPDGEDLVIDATE